MNKYNPTIVEFLQKNEDVTVVGLYWAGLWRLYVAIALPVLIGTIVLTLLTNL